MTNKKEIERISFSMLLCSAIVDQLISKLQKNLTPDEFIEWRKKLGFIMGEIHQKALKDVWQINPDLLPKEMGGEFEVPKDLYDDALALTEKIESSVLKSALSSEPK